MRRLLVSLAISLTAVAAQAGIVYQVNQQIGDGSVTGFIETNGSLGAIGFNDFISYELTLTSPNFTAGSPAYISSIGDNRSYSYNQGSFDVDDAAIQATATDLIFDAGASGTHFIIFWDPTYTHWWCLESAGCSGNRGQSIGYGVNTYAERSLTNQSFVFASVANSVPEPSTLLMLATALAGLAMFRPRGRR